MFGRLQRQRSSAPAAHPPLYVHNTRTGTREEFTPLRAGEVRMYNCGPTVYDYAHIGNLRSFVFADTLKRVFKHNGYRVRQVINITDVGHLTGENAGDADTGEDKMMQALAREGLTPSIEHMQQVGTKYADAFFADLDALNADTQGTRFPRASEHIEGQIALIQTLTEKGYTYTTSDGIYFDTARFPAYGTLGNIDTDQLRAGARVAENTEKRQPADFALWKFNTAFGWDSPWGQGFPGWHIECSAMVYELLGAHIDVHTGGVDHIATHHNNEIAQSESAFGAPLARFWLHNEFITVEGQKISKSLGNTITLRHIGERGYSPLAFRYWLLSAHYTTPTNFTWDALGAAHTALIRLHRHFVEHLGTRTGTPDASYMQRLTEAVNDDVDTPKALALLWELEKDNTLATPVKRATFCAFDAVLGLGFRYAHTRLTNETTRIAVSDIPDVINEKVAARERAREQKDFERADTLRAEIQEAGFDITDTEDGPALTRR